MARQRVVFVSCGQRTSEEIQLGRALAEVIGRNGMRAFFGQDVHSAGDLNSEAFKAIQTCDAFLGILQKHPDIAHPATLRKGAAMRPSSCRLGSRRHPSPLRGTG